MQLTRLALPRKLTREQASEMVGEMVTEREPSLLTPGTVIHDADTDEPVLAYLPLAEPAALRRAAISVDFDKSTLGRQKNYRSRSRTFGFAPSTPGPGEQSAKPQWQSDWLPEIWRFPGDPS